MTETNSNKKQILIVDDDKFLLDMYSVKFTECGLAVHPCHSAEEALETLRAGEHIDAILTDIVMPGMDGFELIQTIKTENINGNAPVIVLSNQGDETDIEKANELGAAGYIIKASTIPSEVLEKVLAVIEQHNKAASA